MNLRDSYAPPLIGLLRELGADRVGHGNRTLLDHLVATARLLESWGAADDVCRAGLFHSIYGTDAFEHSVLSFDERPRVVELIGERAERLAYVFCRFEPHSLFRAIARGEPYFVDLLGGEGPLSVTTSDLSDLLAIFWANLLDQLPNRRPTLEERGLLLNGIEQSRPFVSARAYAELRETYEATPTAP